MKTFGVKNREDRKKEKNKNKLTSSISFTISTKLKEEIIELKELGNFNSNSEFLRICVNLNKNLMKLAKKGYTELSISNPETKERVFLHLDHLIKVKKGE